MIEPPPRTPLSPAAARRLLEETPHVRDPELSRALTGTVFALADGRALVFSERGRSMLYGSRNEIAAYYGAVVEQSRSGHSPLLDVLPQGEGFAAAVPALLQELPARLHVEASVLDYSVASLGLVDRAVRRLERTSILSPEIFPLLLAYVGEVIRRAVNGRWEMRLADDNRSWMPWIVAGGNSYQVLRMHKELLEHGRSTSLRSFVEYMIGHPSEV